MTDVERLSEELRSVALGVLERQHDFAGGAVLLVETVANAIALHLCSEDRVVTADERVLALRLACGLGRADVALTLDAADAFLGFLQGRPAEGVK